MPTFSLASIGLGAFVLWLVLWPSKVEGQSRLELLLQGLGYKAPTPGGGGWASGGQSWGNSGGGGPGASSGWDNGDTGSDAGAGATAVTKALDQIGTPYVWGGAAIGGFDCSGLTQWAYRLAGVSLPRTAQQQYNVATPTQAPKRGDLVFFTGTYPTGDFISHVGLYLGDGQMVSAQNGGVLVAPVTSGYWADHLVGFGKVA